MRIDPILLRVLRKSEPSTQTFQKARRGRLPGVAHPDPFEVWQQAKYGYHSHATPEGDETQCRDPHCVVVRGSARSVGRVTQPDSRAKSFAKAEAQRSTRRTPWPTHCAVEHPTTPNHNCNLPRQHMGDHESSAGLTWPREGPPREETHRPFH